MIKLEISNVLIVTDYSLAAFFFENLSWRCSRIFLRSPILKPGRQLGDRWSFILANFGPDPPAGRQESLCLHVFFWLIHD